MTPHIVIVGAGLGGATLADALASEFEVTVIELPNDKDLGKIINDVGCPANLNPHVGSGLGGSTKYWHNGLIEIEEAIFDSRWPYPKSTLLPYYKKAFELLTGISYSEFKNIASELKDRLNSCKIPPQLLNEGLYYASIRRNVWSYFDLNKRVKVIRAEALSFNIVDDTKVVSLKILNEGKIQNINADTFILSAGGVGTPLLLQGLKLENQSISLKNAGRFYEDHPTSFVAEIEVSTSIYRLWNFKKSAVKGSFRVPMVIVQDGLRIAFQLRPAFYLNARNHIVSMLNDLRNHPFNVGNYFKLFFLWDDIFEIISFKLGFNFPTNKFTLLMVAEQSNTADLSIYKESEDEYISRNWVLSDNYLKTLDSAISKLIETLSDIVTNVRIYPGWHANIGSSAHHSGTARMHLDAELGVCDQHGRVYGLRNLFLCDGSMIPASGTANTGLTIAALALKLADYIKSNNRRDV